MAQTSPVHTTQNLDCLFFFGVTRCLCGPKAMLGFFFSFPRFIVSLIIWGLMADHHSSIFVASVWGFVLNILACGRKACVWRSKFCCCRRSAQSGRSQTCTLLSLLPMGILSPGAGVGVTWTGSARQCADNSTVLTTCDPVNQFVFWLCCI